MSLGRLDPGALTAVGDCDTGPFLAGHDLVFPSAVVRSNLPARNAAPITPAAALRGGSVAAAPRRGGHRPALLLLALLALADPAALPALEPQPAPGGTAGPGGHREDAVYLADRTWR